MESTQMGRMALARRGDTSLVIKGSRGCRSTKFHFSKKGKAIKYFENTF
jgi:hypothetical protein